MNTFKLRKRVYGVVVYLLVLAILVTSCGFRPSARDAEVRPQDSGQTPQAAVSEDSSEGLIETDAPFVPGQRKLPDSVDMDRPYLQVAIPQDILPEPTPLQSKQEVVELDNGESITVESFQGQATTNAHGVAAFTDPETNTIIPLVLLNEEQAPLQGLLVDYVLVNDHITLLVSDPDEIYAPQLVVINRTQLQNAEADSSASHYGLRNPLAPRVAYAEPVTIATIAAIVLIVLAFVALYNFVGKTIEVAKVTKTEPEQIFYSAQGFKFTCTTPRLLAARTSYRWTLLFAFLPSSGHESAKGVLFSVGEHILPELLEKGFASHADEPILWQEYLFTPAQSAVISSWWQILTKEGVHGLDFGRKIGTCAYVPDLVGKTLEEARLELEELGIAWSEVFMDEAGQPLLETLLEGVVVDQNPGPTFLSHDHDAAGVGIRSMLPVGEVEGFANKLELAVIPSTPALTPIPISSCFGLLTESESSDSASSIDNILFSPSGELLALSSTNGSIRVCQVSDWSLLYTLQIHSRAVKSIAIDPTGTIMAVTRCQEDSSIICLFRMGDGHMLRTLSNSFPANDVAFSPDGSLLVSAHADGAIEIWDRITGTRLHTLKGHTHHWVTRVVFSNDGTVLASAGHDWSVRLWRVPGWESIYTLFPQPTIETGIAFSPDGDLLATANRNFGIRLWNLADGTLSHTFEVMATHNVVFSPDGVLIAAHDNRSIKIWRVADGTLLQTIDESIDSVRSFAFSPDGQLLVIGSHTGIVQPQRLESGQ